MFGLGKREHARHGRFIVLLNMLLALLSFMASGLSVAVVASDEWLVPVGISVDQGTRFYDRPTRAYYTYNSITNQSDIALEGSVRIVVTNTTHPVTNATGTTETGQPFYDVLATGQNLAKGATSNQIRINFERKRGAFSYNLEVQKFVVQMDTDSDNDGIPDATDSCPFDSENDSDNDGICGDVDICPLDPENDADTDGICGDIDACPLDPNNDIDGDGVCGNEDFCPNDADNNCINLTGMVYGEGSAIAGAQIKIGNSVATVESENSGAFSAKTGGADLLNDGLNDFLPIQVKAPGYATGDAKVVFQQDKFDYSVEVHLAAISDTIGSQEDVAVGVDIDKEGNKVGELTIPTVAFPDGVNEIKGSITYLDPATDDIQSFPGGDFLSLPIGSDPNDPPVPLESFGLMEFDLVDQDGNPIQELNTGQTAEVCMQSQPGMSADDVVPLWWYDETRGLWIEEGQGIVEIRGDKLMICGQVSHFTWWNYDQPVTTHACFKYRFIDEITSADLSDSMDWYAEGVTYNGTSPERPCDCDGNDPLPCPTVRIDSLTVKKSTVGSLPEQIRVYTQITGLKYYLVQDGDGTYGLTDDQSAATVFDNPTVQASCFANENVEECQFLDHADNGVDLLGPDGVLPLKIDIELPPIISNFQVIPVLLREGGSPATVSAMVTDPEGSDVTLTWVLDCYGNSSSDDEALDPIVDSGPSGSNFTTNFTPPTEIFFPVIQCLIELTATDAGGNSRTAVRWVQVRRDDLSLNCTFQGNIYGLDGQPIVGRSVSLQGAVVSSCSQNLGELSYTESILTGADGSYRFEEIPCCQDCSGVIDGEFRGDLSFDFMRAGTNWTYHEAIDLDCVGAGCNNRDSYLPSLWGSLQGAVYQPDSPAVPFSELHIGSDMGFFGFGKKLLTTNIPVLPDGNGGVAYGPLEVPVGHGIVSDQSVDITELFGGGDLNTTPQARDYWLPVVNGLSVADFGEATATLTGKVFRDDGTLVADGTQVALQSTYGFFGSGVWSATATTNSGVYSATVPLTGTVQVFVETAEPSDQDPWRINQGLVNIAGQVVTVDVNSTETCIVEGTLYDYQGNPLAVSNIGLSSVSGNSTFDQSFSTSTDGSGQFSFSAVHPGIATLFGTVCQNDDNVGVFCQFNLMNPPIPNCRPVDSAEPMIQVDLPLLNLLDACSN